MIAQSRSEIMPRPQVVKADADKHGMKSLKRKGASLVAASLAGVSLIAIPSMAVHRGDNTTAVSTNVTPKASPSKTGSSFKTQTVFFAPNSKNQVFITIDDGFFPEQGAYNFLKSNKISTTSFIIRDAMDEHLAFWKAYAKIGNLEDHTVSHPDLTTISYAADVSQIKGQRDAITLLTGVTPYMLRPPYGDTDAQVVAAAQQSGMRYVVMWSAVLDYNANGVYTANPPLQTWNGGKLTSGEIILVHWDPGVTGALEYLVNLIRSDGLSVGYLANYLTR